MKVDACLSVALPSTISSGPNGAIRHLSCEDRILDGFRPGTRLLEGFERERRAALSVARGAALVDEPRDFARIGNLGGKYIVGADHNAGAHNEEYSQESHYSPLVDDAPCFLGENHSRRLMSAGMTMS